MQMTKKVLSVVLAVMMVVSMMAVGTVVAYADAENAGTIENLADLNYAAQHGGTYELTGDISISSGYIWINQGVDLTLTGNGSITSSSQYMFVVDGGTLTLNGGTYTDTYAVANNGYSYVIYNMNNGTVNVSGSKVTINANSPDYEKATGIATYKATTNFRSAKINAEGWGMTFYTDAVVNIKSGTINSTGYGISANGNEGQGGYTVNITGGTINGGELGIYHNNDGTLNISGGTVNGETGLYIKSGVTNITGGTINGTGAKNSYQDWQNGGHPTGDAIVLDYDQAYQHGGPVDVNIYNGATVKSTNAQPISDNTREGNYVVHDTEVIYGGKFTSTNDTVDSAALAALCVDGYTASATTGGFEVQDVKEARIGDVKYDTFAEAVAARTGDEVIIPLRNGIAAYTMTSDDQIVKVARVKINGANVLPTIKAPEGSEKVLTYSYQSTGEIFTYYMTDVVATLTSGGTVTKYASFSSAWNNAKNGDTVTLLRDATDNWVGKRTYNFNVDLGGHTITLTSPRTYTWLIYGKNTISNGTIVFNPNEAVGTDIGFRLEAGGELTLQNVTVNATGNVSPVFLTKNCTVNVDDGAKINSTDTWAIATHGSTGNSGYTINVKPGSEVTATNAPAIYQANNGALNITGGTITGTEAIYVKSGTTTVSGGTLVATGAAADYTYNGNGTNHTGDAVVVDNCSYPGGAPTITVTGGTFESANAQPVASYASQQTSGVDNEPVGGFVSGGTFNKRISSTVVEDGLVPVVADAEEGTYTVGQGTYVAEVGAEKFTSFKDARNYARDNYPDGATIKLLSDVSTGDSNFGISTKVTLDLNGKTLSGNGTVLTTINNGELTVKNGTITSPVEGGWVLRCGNGASSPGKITIEDDAVITATGSGSGGAVMVAPNSTLDVYGTINAKDYGVFPWGSNATVNVYEGAAITSENAAALSGNGSPGNEGYVMNVYGGNLTSVNDVAIYQSNAGALNITGGTVCGPTGIYIKSGTSSISGTTIGGSATIKGTGEKTDLVHSNNGCSPTGDAIVIENCGYPGDTPSVEISGGTITSTHADAVSSYGYESYTPVTGFVSGGDFSSEVPETYCAPGFEPAPQDQQTGMYTVQVDTNPLNQKIDNSIIKASQAAAQDGNKFGLPGTLDYTKGRILGVQKKEAIMTDVAGIGIRFIAEAEKATLDDAQAYGFEICKTSKTNTPDFADADGFNTMAQYKDDPTKVVKVNCKGTSNTVVGGGYGDAAADTAYKYVTLAVNDIPADQGVAVRFYVTDSNGDTHYAKYVRAGDVNMYDGCCTSYANLG